MPEISSELRALNNFFATLVLDPGGRIIRANSAFLDLLGYELDELRGRHEASLAQECDGGESPDWERLRLGGRQSLTVQRKNRHGQALWLEAMYYPVCDAAGTLLEVVVIARDRTGMIATDAAERARVGAIGRSSPVARLGLDGEVLEANPLFHAMLGHPDKTLVGAQYRDLCDVDAMGADVFGDFWDALCAGLPQDSQQLFRSSEGAMRWLRVMASPVVDAQGAVAEIFMLAEDVTRDRQRQTDNAWQIAAIHKSHAVISFDMNGIVLDANSRFLELMEYERADVIGRHHRMFVDAAYSHGAEYAGFWRVLSRGQHQAGQYRRVARDGREVWLQASYNPIFDLAGNPVKIVKYATDITDEKVRQAEHQGQIAAIHKSQCVISFDLEGRVLDANDNFLEATGYRLGDIRGAHHSMFVPEEHVRSEEYRQFWKALANGQHRSGEFHRVTATGADLWLQASYNPIFDLSGKPMKIIKYAYDVTDEKQRHAQFEGQIKAIRKAQGVISFALDGTVLDANTKFLDMVGYELDELVGQRHEILVDPGQVNGCEYLTFWDKLRAGEYMTGRFERISKQGERIWLQASYNPIFDLAGNLVNIVKFATDVTQDVALADAYEEARQQSQHDPVTSLPNRARLASFLATELAIPNARMAVIYCDLDRFKRINDTFGHALGDRVLGEVADRLRRVLRHDQLVARVGGDEFVIAAPGLAEDEAEVLCQSILAAMEAPLRHEAGDITIGISLGIALSPHDGTTADTLLRNADQALYGAKQGGRGTFQFYASEMNERVAAHRRLVDELRRGIAADEFFLEYQPRFEPRSLSVVGAEALVRWAHPEKGRMAPCAFIPAAESSGLILPLGEWIMRTACMQAASWDGDLRVSVNVSPVQFRDRNLTAIVADALAQAGLPADRLEIEVTEGVLLEDPERAQVMLRELKELGVSLAIDDFGTGYASLSYLRNYPFDMIKIDRQFVSDIGEREGGRAIVQAILGLGNAMGIAVTAEGVENAGQLASLINDQCREVQGYLLARPMALPQFAEFLVRAQQGEEESEIIVPAAG
ncbi:MAG: PAS domain S-box protein [Novosphingobium aromaticivorans]|nr:PAS domain S-box protein [Novosphingobium aromaticivorans]